MNRIIYTPVLLLCILFSCKQKDKEIQPATNGNSLLWKISGNGLEKPSYLYGTMHILCKEDAVLSREFESVIKATDAIYFEVDLANADPVEMMESMKRMKMRGDTTLDDLLSESDLANLKDYVKGTGYNMIYSEMLTYLPILTATMLSQELQDCGASTGIEDAITVVAKEYKKKTFGIETLDYQLRIMDSIPYAAQAKELVIYIDSLRKPGGLKTEKERLMGFNKLYTSQNLDSLNKIMFVMAPEFMTSYGDLLLYNRNRNWVAALKQLLKEKSLILAVGAGHLPGENGVIDLLKKEGYEVTPLQNTLPQEKK
ncbi:MAG TPA: TraB/GumN family protein [Chitinophagaceae bacterium]